MIDDFFDWVYDNSLWARNYLLAGALVTITIAGWVIGFPLQIVCAILGAGYTLAKRGLTKFRS